MAGRNITVKLMGIAFEANYEKATITKPSNSNVCVGQPGHEAHEPLAVTAPTTCAACGPIVDRTVLMKGIKEGNELRIISQEDLAATKAEFTGEYKDTIDLIVLEASEFFTRTAPAAMVNHLKPRTEAGADHFAMLVRLIEDHPELAFVGLYTPSSVASLFALRVQNGALVMEQRARGQELKPMPTYSGEVANEAVFAAISSTLPTQVSAYDADAFEDRYAAALHDLAVASDLAVSLKAEAAGTPVQPIEASDDIIARMALLRAAS